MGWPLIGCSRRWDDETAFPLEGAGVFKLLTLRYEEVDKDAFESLVPRANPWGLWRWLLWC